MKKILPGLISTLVLLILPTGVLASTLAVSPSTGTINTSCNFSVDILLDTAGAQTDGTDVILFYDPTRLSVSSITNGTLYQDYPLSAADPQNSRITISGLASVSTPFSGSGKFATVNFTIPQNAPAGPATLNFDFDPSNPSKTTDSNVVERGTVNDTLASVTNGNYTIGTGSCANQTVPVASSVPVAGKGGIISSSSASPSSLIKQLPKAGADGTTMVLAIVGSVLTVAGIIGLAIL